jgi:predicted NBD/HSP70 family sugar kinase
LPVTIDHADGASPFERPAVTATLAALHDGQPRTLTALAESTGLSRPTIEDALARLTDLRVAQELAPDGRDRRVGRPARQDRFRPETGLVLGLDIGEHRVVAMLADLTGTTLATLTQPVSATDPGDDRLAAVRGTIRALLTNAGFSRSDLWATAAGTAGVVDAEGRVVVSEVLPDWTGRNLAAQLRRSLGCVVRLENDANLAALGEHWRGAAIGVDDVIYLHASHRLGAGILIGGRVHRGFGGAAGEIGSLRLLHWDSAARHLARLDRPVAADDLDNVAERVFEAARAGDTSAVATVEEFGHDLAAGIAAMTSTIDPELVVIGGRAARGGEVLAGPVRRRLHALCVRPPDIALSTLGDEAVAQGAVRSAVDYVEREVFKFG